MVNRCRGAVAATTCHSVPTSPWTRCCTLAVTTCRRQPPCSSTKCCTKCITHTSTISHQPSDRRQPSTFALPLVASLPCSAPPCPATVCSTPTSPYATVPASCWRTSPSGDTRTIMSPTVIRATIVGRSSRSTSSCATSLARAKACSARTLPPSASGVPRTWRSAGNCNARL